MSTTSAADRAPGDVPAASRSLSAKLAIYGIGLAFAALLTIGSFLITAYGSDMIYGPGVPVALIVFAIAQMGVHLVFFLHINTGPDSRNTILALAFGILIVFLVLAGSLWIMANLNA